MTKTEKIIMELEIRIEKLIELIRAEENSLKPDVAKCMMWGARKIELEKVIIFIEYVEENKEYTND